MSLSSSSSRIFNCFDLSLYWSNFIQKKLDTSFNWASLVVTCFWLQNINGG